jgi:nucleoid DNA-binding protein
MATKPKAAKKATSTKKPAAKKAAPKAAPKVVAVSKPIKEALSKSGLAAHLAQTAGVALKDAKALLAALEATVVASVNKKGLGSFTLPGLMKVVAQNVPAKAKRFGKDPFTGVERWFPAKPATVRVKVRALKKLKDAAA